MSAFGDPKIRALEKKGKVQKIVRALKHTKPSIREDAARALGRIGDSSTVMSLIDALSDPDIRWCAVKALGMIGDRIAIDPLIPFLRDDDWNVRRASAEALSTLGWEPGDRTLRLDYLFAANKFVELLKEGGDEAVGTLARELDELPTVQDAIKALGEIGGDSAAKALTEYMTTLAFSSSESEIGNSIQVVRALKRIGGAASPFLMKALKEGHAHTKYMIAEILPFPDNGQSISALHDLVQDGHHLVRYQACVSLGWIEGPARLLSVEALLKAARDSNEQVRVAAAVALAKTTRDLRVVEVLVDELQEAERNAADFAAIAEALGEIGDTRAIEPLVAILNAHLEGRRGSKRGTEIGESLPRALAKIGDERAIEPLIDMVVAGAGDIRVFPAIEALVEFGALAVPALRNVLRTAREAHPNEMTWIHAESIEDWVQEALDAIACGRDPKP